MVLKPLWLIPIALAIKKTNNLSDTFYGIQEFTFLKIFGEHWNTILRFPDIS